MAEQLILKGTLEGHVSLFSFLPVRFAPVSLMLLLLLLLLRLLPCCCYCQRLRWWVG